MLLSIHALGAGVRLHTYVPQMPSIWNEFDRPTPKRLKTVIASGLFTALSLCAPFTPLRPRDRRSETTEMALPTRLSCDRHALDTSDSPPETAQHFSMFPPS